AAPDARESLLSPAPHQPAPDHGTPPRFAGARCDGGPLAGLRRRSILRASRARPEGPVQGPLLLSEGSSGMHVLLVHQAFAGPRDPGGTRHFELASELALRGHRTT